MQFPFTYNQSVTGKNFVGRKEECNLLTELISNGQNICMYEPPKSGKMSIIKEAINRAETKSGPVQVVYINLFNTRQLGDFLTLLVEEIQKVLPDFAPVMKLGEILQTLKEVSKTSEKRIIIIIDEFHSLLRLDEHDKIFKIMESNFDEVNFDSSSSVNFILISSMVNAMKYIFEEVKYFHRKIHKISLSTIEEYDAIEYIIRGFTPSGKVIERSLATQIYQMYQGNIWYINHHSAVCNSLTKGYVNDTVVAQAHKSILSIHEPKYISRMYNLSNYQISLLKAIVEGNTKFSSEETMLQYKLSSSANIKRIKEALLKKEIITFDSRNEPKIQDPLFEHWLKNKYFENK